MPFSSDKTRQGAAGGSSAAYWGERGVNCGDSGGTRASNTIDYICF